MPLTPVALHTSHPQYPIADERTISIEDFASYLLTNHGVPGDDWQSMTIRDSDGVEARCWFSWAASARRYGTDFHIRTAGGVVLRTIRLPGIWHGGAAMAVAA